MAKAASKTIDFPVLNRWSGEVQFTATIEADDTTPISVKVGLAVKWAIKNKANLRYADLTSANLTSANLTSADLTSANLRYADLRYADLTSANLTSANLRYADLRYADLTSANLRYADLRYADLRYADLTSANLRYAKNLVDFTMSDGMRFGQYLADVVPALPALPALLVAGGKTMAEIEASGCWDCHSWDNCPMHVAFDITDPAQGPPLLRGRIAEFIQLFDAKMIPAPWAPVPVVSDEKAA
jgi:hypothetical protein